MGIPNGVLDVVVDVLLDPEREANSTSLQTFEDFVVALCADSQLPEREVQSCLVERMLLDQRHTTIEPTHTTMTGNVIRLDDYLHLLQVN